MQNKVLKVHKIKISFFLIILASNVFAGQVDLNLLNSSLRKVDSYMANFTHKTFNEIGDVLQLSKGKVALLRPKKFLWHITEPSTDIVIINDNIMLHYDEELQQLTKQRLSAEQELFPLELLLSRKIEKIAEMFKVKKVAAKMCLEEYNACFELEPIAVESSVKKIYIGIANGVIHSLRLWDQLDQLSEFSFNQIVLDEKIKNSVFEFTPSEEIDTIDYVS